MTTNTLNDITSMHSVKSTACAGCKYRTFCGEENQRQEPSKTAYCGAYHIFKREDEKLTRMRPYESAQGEDAYKR